MFARRIAAVVATVLAGAGAGVCGASPASAAASASREEAAAVIPAPPVTRAARTVTPAATTLRNTPSGFRLPPGSRVADLSDRASGASFTLTAPGSDAVLAFYRRDLPRAAFTIVTDREQDDATSLTFRDENGWAGAIFATPHRVTVAVKRS